MARSPFLLSPSSLISPRLLASLKDIAATATAAATNTRSDADDFWRYGAGWEGPSGDYPRPKPSADENSLVYALGQLGYEFVSEARRESFQRSMQKSIGETDVYDIDNIEAYLKRSPFEAASLIWILRFDNIPVYAIKPDVSFSRYLYEAFFVLLRKPIIAMAGYVADQVRLLSGQVVPSMLPSVSVADNSARDWVRALLRMGVKFHQEDGGKYPTNPEVDFPQGASAIEQYSYVISKIADDDLLKAFSILQAEKPALIIDILNKRYRTLGRSPVERVRNFVIYDLVSELLKATATALAPANGNMPAGWELANLEIESITIERSAATRPSSDCYDVTVSVASSNPHVRFEWIVRHSFTVDVGDLVPVVTGPITTWRDRPSRPV